MRKTALIAAATAAAIATLGPSAWAAGGWNQVNNTGGGQPPSATTPSPASMQAEIAALQSELATLQSEVTALQAQVSALQANGSASGKSTVPATPPTPQPSTSSTNSTTWDVGTNRPR